MSFWLTVLAIILGNFLSVFIWFRIPGFVRFMADSIEGVSNFNINTAIPPNHDYEGWLDSWQECHTCGLNMEVCECCNPLIDNE